jgi:uncharacterized protein
VDEQQVVAPQPGDLRWGLPAFLCGFGAYYLISVAIAAAVPSGLIHSGPLLLLPLVANLFLGLVPAIWSWLLGHGIGADFGFLPRRGDFGVGLAYGAISLGVGVALALVIAELLHPAPVPVPTGGVTVWLVGYVVFLVVGAPVTEELLVRGALWGALEHHRVPRGVILVFTALIFAFLHLQPDRLLSLFAQGLAIGAARMITGRIGASMVAHATNNLLPALLLL